MDFLLSRYRNLTVLLVAIAAQLVLLAYQVKSNEDVRLIRIWAVTAVTPLARLIEGVRAGTTGFFSDYFVLWNTREENRRLRSEVGQLKLENQYLRNELSTADRARALAAFQMSSPSRTIAARIIGNGTGANSKVMFVDRGSTSNVQRGMAVITPDGIVGKVIASYPTAAQIMLITDPSFAAGVISQKNRVHGTLKGQGHSTVQIDYVQPEQKVEVGEWFYTSGDDRVFPKGMPVGQVSVVRDGPTFKEVYVAPSAFKNGLEEVLIVIEGVHQMIPEVQDQSGPVSLLPPPPPEGDVATTAEGAPIDTSLSTEADRMREKYKRIGEAQGHVYGVGLPGGRPPDFNINPDQPKPPATTPGAAKPPVPGGESGAGNVEHPAASPAKRAPAERPPR